MAITKTCLLLGKIKDTLKLKKAILKKKWLVICKNKIIKTANIKNIDLIVTFNYRYILEKKSFEKIKKTSYKLAHILFAI